MTDEELEFIAAYYTLVTIAFGVLISLWGVISITLTVY